MLPRAVGVGIFSELYSKKKKKKAGVGGGTDLGLNWDIVVSMFFSIVSILYPYI